MSAVTYPEPMASPNGLPTEAATTLAALPESASPRWRVGAAVVAAAAVVVAAVAVLWWPSPDPDRSALMAGIAEQVAVAHLHGDTDTLARLVALELPDGLDRNRFFVRSASAVAIRGVDGGWAVTVAAELLEAVPGGFGLPRVEHYEVVFGDRATGPVVLGLPGLISAPPAVPVRAASPPAAPNDALTAAVHDFLVSGPLADFDAVDVTGMVRTSDSDRTLVLVEVTAAGSGRAPRFFHYSLEASESDGTWTVARRFG